MGGRSFFEQNENPFHLEVVLPHPDFRPIVQKGKSRNGKVDGPAACCVRPEFSVTPHLALQWIVEWTLAGSAMLYLSYSGVLAHLRIARSWGSLSSTLRRGEVGEIFATAETVVARGEPVQAALFSRSALRALYRGAGVSLEMADYAERNAAIDPQLLEALRSDAMQLRLLALKRLLQTSAI
jgi:hypothetical protein